MKMTRIKTISVMLVFAAILLALVPLPRVQSADNPPAIPANDRTKFAPVIAGKDLAGNDEAHTATSPAGQPATSPPELPAKAADVVPNLLHNGSVEDGDKLPAHWKQGAQVEGVEFIWDRMNGQTGKSSLGFSKTAQRYFPIAQWFQEVEWKGGGSLLHVSAQVKAENLTKAILDVQFLDDAGTWVGHKWVSYIGEEDDGPPLTHDWKKYQGDVPVPPGTKAFRVGLQIYGPGKVWFDDVRASVAGELKNQTELSGQRHSDETELKLELATRKLAKQVRAATGPEQELLRRKLEDTVTVHFKHRQNRRKVEIEELAQRVNQMRQLFMRREDKQAEIVKSRV